MKSWPVIGVSGSHNIEGKYLFLRENYLNSVIRAGGLPVLLPETTDDQMVEVILDHIDGLLLSGGCDVLPARYGEATLPACGEVDEQRDAFEMLITRKAIERGMPVFGICRGVQLLTVLLGGTLIQDIESQCGIPNQVHNQKAPYDAPVHSVNLLPGGFFAALVGGEPLSTNSMHHQAIKDAGPQLRVEGTSEDGIIEAVCVKDDDRCIYGVQFHPEYLAEQDPRMSALFAHLVRKAEAYSQK